MEIPTLKSLTEEETLNIIHEWETGSKMRTAKLYKHLTGDTSPTFDIYKLIADYVTKYWK